jgi:hypothetical protein
MKDNYMPSPVYDCFHIYSYGTNVNLLFESREDKIFIMNIIAAYSYGDVDQIIEMPKVATVFSHFIIEQQKGACAGQHRQDQ